jgi:hypothetical protein
MTQMNASEEENQEIEHDEIDASTLTRKQKEALILDMQAEEMMKKREQVKEALTTPEKKKKKRKRKKDVSEMSGAEIAPGFGWVVIKMATAMTFSMVFVLIGPILTIFSIFKLFQTEWSVDWNALYFSGYLIFVFVGIGMVVAAWYLFKYIIRD